VDEIKPSADEVLPSVDEIGVAARSAQLSEGLQRLLVFFFIVEFSSPVSYTIIIILCSLLFFVLL
jgi:hypothetical protein